MLRNDTVTSSVFDQSLLNWQGLQEWAQKTWDKRYVCSFTRTFRYDLCFCERALLFRYRHTLGDDANIVQTMHMTDMTSPTQTDAAPRDRSFSEHSSMTSGSDVTKDFDWSTTVRASTKKRRVFMPRVSRHFAWFLLVCVTLAGATITVLYGFQ